MDNLFWNKAAPTARKERWSRERWWALHQGSWSRRIEPWHLKDNPSNSHCHPCHDTKPLLLKDVTSTGQVWREGCLHIEVDNTLHRQDGSYSPPPNRAHSQPESYPCQGKTCLVCRRKKIGQKNIPQIGERSLFWKQNLKTSFIWGFYLSWSLNLFFLDCFLTFSIILGGINLFSKSDINLKQHF